MSRNAKTDFIAHSIVGGELLGLLSDAYYFAGFFDLFLKLFTTKDEDAFGLSYPGMAVGIFIAALASASSYYCHSKLNALPQDDADEAPPQIVIPTEAPPQIVIPSEIVIPSASTSALDPLIPVVANAVSDQKSKLGFFVMLALLGNLVAASATIAAGPTFVVNLSTRKNPLSDGILLAINVISFVAGVLFGGIADTRTCYRALVKIHKRLHQPVVEGTPVHANNQQDADTSTSAYGAAIN